MDLEGYLEKECGRPVKLDTYDFILSTVSVGNISQFALDLLINSLDFRFSFHSHLSNFVLPVVGPDPFTADTSCPQRLLSTQLEVFHSVSHNLLVLQQRSDYVRAKKKQFLDGLCQWIKKNNFRRVVLLTSSFTSAEVDDSVRATCRYLTNSGSYKQFEAEISSNRYVAVKLKSEQYLGFELLNGNSKKPCLTGAGLAKSLSKRCEDMDIPLLVLVKYCMEGTKEQAVGDSVELADYCNEWLKLKPQTQGWTFPLSWADL